ncbi:hypothetical protein APHAL10511_000440 [Amanita phalloides]|nr:hypothetical protein APHAL10511_000440 [Amanita phalloides]
MDLYKKWDQYLRNSEEEKIHGVEVAVKVDIGLQYIIVKVEVTHEDAGHVENMIDKLGHQVLINWVWYKRPHRVAFLIRMKPDGEEEVKEYLGKLRRPRA